MLVSQVSQKDKLSVCVLDIGITSIRSVTERKLFVLWHFSLIDTSFIILFYDSKTLREKNFSTESAHWDNTVSKLQCLSVCLCHFFQCLITPIYKDWKSNQSIAKKNSLGFRNFGLKMVKKLPRRKKFFWFYCLGLIVDGSKSRSAASSYCV